MRSFIIAFIGAAVVASALSSIFGGLIGLAELTGWGLQVASFLAGAVSTFTGFIGGLVAATIFGD